MTRCSQCNGNKVVIGTEAAIDPNSNVQTFQGGGPKPGATPCQQCNGTGIQNSFGV